MAQTPDVMATIEQRPNLLEDRVAHLEDACVRNVGFIGKKLVEHAIRLHRIEEKVDVLNKKVDRLDAKVERLAVEVAGIKAGMDALPAVIAQTIRDEFAARDRKSAS